jgi:L-lactate utilization protein LutB
LKFGIERKDYFPQRIPIRICGLCAFSVDCDSVDPLKTQCPDFIRRTTIRNKETQEENQKEKKYDLSHLNKKANGLALLRGIYIQKQQEHYAAIRNLEKEIRKLDKEIQESIVAVNKIQKQSQQQQQKSQQQQQQSKRRYKDIEGLEL